MKNHIFYTETTNNRNITNHNDNFRKLFNRFVQENMENDINRLITNKIDGIKDEPFMVFDIREELKNSTLDKVVLEASLNLFNTLKTLQREFEDTSMENARKYVVKKDIYPIYKMQYIKNLLKRVEKEMFFHKEKNCYPDDIKLSVLYATFLTLMDELKGTIKEPNIENYVKWFHFAYFLTE